jgi:hypothetical protein
VLNRKLEGQTLQKVTVTGDGAGFAYSFE